jgi:hypothetical protein
MKERLYDVIGLGKLKECVCVCVCVTERDIIGLGILKERVHETIGLGML